ncbi:pickpocket protein 19-like [Apis dorsata]|uniref:pickpocket protein 19-like n=1 Tax=Apis dorsata TaxID=7462 RepID=UPI001293FB86|nr:pickpocket protein 19-like [Apis dorsata]
MTKKSVTKTLETTLEKSEYFCENEILPDLQARQRITSRKEKSAYPTMIGLPSINPKSVAGKYFVKFASSGTLHGLNHLVAPNKHPFERFLILVFVVGALVCLIVLSSIFWDRYQNNATVIVMDNNKDSFKIPRWSLFVCMAQTIDPMKMTDVFKKYEIKDTPEAREFFTFLGTVTYENMMETPIYDKVPANKWLEILYDLKQDIGSNLLSEKPFDPYETWMVTEKGFCLVSRNIINIIFYASYWKNNNWTTIPIPDDLQNYDTSIDTLIENFNIPFDATFTVSDPFELITYDISMIRTHAKKIYRNMIFASQIQTKPNVQELSIRQRKCKFFGDGGLKTWPVYTKNMCIIECRMKIIQDNCNCRPHFARPIDGVNTCNATQLRCIGNIRKKLFLYEYPFFCKCISNCDIVSYQIKNIEDTNIEQMEIKTNAIIMITELPQIIYYRSLLYGFTDLLTSIGGAAGLFLGASVLSFVEIFYYGTIHLFFYIKENRWKSKKTTKMSN